MQLMLHYITLQGKLRQFDFFLQDVLILNLFGHGRGAAHAKSRMGPIMVNPALSAQGTLLSTRNGMHDT